MAFLQVNIDLESVVAGSPCVTEAGAVSEMLRDLADSIAHNGVPPGGYDMRNAAGTIAGRAERVQ